MVNAITGTVISQKQWSDKLFSIRIKATINPFESGQFGRIGLALNADEAPVMRPYSFVSTPDDNHVEFYYSIVEGGLLTPVLPTLKAGDEILINEKVNGFLVLSEIPEAEQLWMISTGTGIGPFISILKSPTVWQRFRHIVLVHSVRYVTDLSYREEIETFNTKGSEGQFQYVPFVSREVTDYSIHGRIPDNIQNKALFEKTRLSISPEKSQFMMCGNPGMVKDTIAMLEEQGFVRNRRRKPGQLTMENYW